MLCLAGRARVGDRVSFGHPRALADAQCPEMRQRRLVPVVRCDRDGQAVPRNLPGERHLTRRRRTYRTGLAERDVDTAMLPGGVLVADDRELAEDRAVSRPRPCPGGRSRAECPRAADEKADSPARCPASEHAATVARDARRHNEVDCLVTESRGRARFATSRSVVRRSRRRSAGTLRQRRDRLRPCAPHRSCRRQELPQAPR